MCRNVVALFGVQREDYTFAPRHYLKRLCGYRGHSRQAAEYAVALISQDRLNLAPLVTHTLPLGRYRDGIDLFSAAGSDQGVLFAVGRIGRVIHERIQE